MNTVLILLLACDSGDEDSAPATTDSSVPWSADLPTLREDISSPRGFEPRPVRLGQTNQTRAEIVEGLAPGERYVGRNTLALKAELNRAALEHAGHAH